jgi:hypothetical protein
MHLASLLAVSWEPEIRGLLSVLIGFVVLCGSVFLILSTNMGVRLGFIVALAGLAGWMALMGAIWWIYGIGLRGPEPAWVEVPGRTVIQDDSALAQAGVLDAPVSIPEDATPAEAAEIVQEQLIEEGWSQIAESEPAFGQAASAAGVFLEETDTFGPGEFQVTAVFETGGERYPKINDSLDQLAFWHTPHYALVEVAALEPLRDEPGRAPTAPVIDESQPRQYVNMVRDLGARRQPAAAITIGSSIVFLALCWMLHRRDKIVKANLEAKAIAAGGPDPEAADRERELVTTS